MKNNSVTGDKGELCPHDLEVCAKLVQRARRVRLFHNEPFTQGAHAAVAILGAFILLLLARHPASGLALDRSGLRAGRRQRRCTVYARKRLLSPYSAAQVVDRRMELADTLSTAVHFEQEVRPRASPADIRQYQRERADRAGFASRWICGSPCRMPCRAAST